ncbi:MAG: hypothetical protein JWP22_3758 [Ramlibacter sp.]|jgi:hypothetical protein|nr:hypothetical protein [Ramlibacter sp.]MDB5915083.1 hypothetical protein [Ramlibacter sp.]
MAYVRPPAGITPPAPGLEREEPAFVPEEDIPSDGPAADSGSVARDERPLQSTDRE